MTEDPLGIPKSVMKEIRHWLRLRIGHEAVMLDDAKKLLRADRDSTKSFRNKMLNDESDPKISSEEDDMMIVGDVTVKQPQPKASMLKNALAAAGLLAGGAGLAVAATPIISGWLDREEKVAPEPPQPPPTTETEDTDTVNVIDLVGSDE